MSAEQGARSDVDQTALRALAEALGFNYESSLAPVGRQIITLGDVRRALAKHPALADAVAETRDYAIVFNGKLLPGRSDLADAEMVVEMGNPACTYQIVRVVPTPKALGLVEFQRLRGDTPSADPDALSNEMFRRDVDAAGTNPQ